jgi:hypothetical protein
LDLSGASEEVRRVIRSVLPVFTRERERPDHIGTCLLIDIDGYPFVVTAGHVIEDLGREPNGRFTVAVGGRLLAILRARIVTKPDDPVDVGLIPLRREAADYLREAGGVFLDSSMVDEAESGDGTDFANLLANTYLAFGFPASRSHSRIQHAQRKARIRGFPVRLTLAPQNCYGPDVSNRHHILLDYDPREIVLEGRPVNPPALPGMSGGGLFRFARREPDTVRLVGLLIETHREHRIIVATRIAVVAFLARKLIAHHPELFS